MAVNEVQSWCRWSVLAFSTERKSIKIPDLHPNIFNKMGTTINLHWLPIYWSRNSIYVLRTNKFLRIPLMSINVNTTNTHPATFDLKQLSDAIWEARTPSVRSKRLPNVRAQSTISHPFRFPSLREFNACARHIVRLLFTSCAWGRLPALNIHYTLVGAQIRKLFIHAINVTIFVCYAQFSFRTILYGRIFIRCHLINK